MRVLEAEPRPPSHPPPTVATLLRASPLSVFSTGTLSLKIE